MWRLLLLLLIPQLTFASNAGIVRGLWYDHETFFAGETVRVYVAIRNNTGGDLSGTVEFYVNGSRIERNNIAALDGRIVESWADWKPSYGTSTVSATLSRTELTTTASGTKAVEVISSLAEDTIFVDYDTDSDGVGDLEDTDDDNDKIDDDTELQNGTDPKKANKPAAENSGSETAETEDEESQVVVETVSPSGSDTGGLEQFLTPSRANTILTNITEVAQKTKEKIDDYRAERELEQKIERGEIDINVNEDGFGAIERISKTDKNKTAAEKPDLKEMGFFGDLLTFFGNILSAIFTGILFILSWYLGHPMLVQLSLLLLILFLLFYTARRLSRRER